MNSNREIVLSVFMILFFVILVVGILTGIFLWDMSTDCGATGGTFSIDGGSAMCRY